MSAPSPCNIYDLQNSTFARTISFWCSKASHFSLVTGRWLLLTGCFWQLTIHNMPWCVWNSILFGLFAIIFIFAISCILINKKKRFSLKYCFNQICYRVICFNSLYYFLEQYSKICIPIHHTVHSTIHLWLYCKSTTRYTIKSNTIFCRTIGLILS